MNKTGLLICLLLFLLATGKISAQFLNCNGLVYFSLDETCTHTIIPEEVLDGGSVSDCVVELDKTPPYGNGPWGAPVLGAADIGKTYGMRVRHLPSGNICTGNVNFR